MLLALADVIAGAPDAATVARANALFDRAMPRTSRLTLHDEAFVVLACAIAPDPARSIVLRALATDLHARVRSFAQAGWPWPERTLGRDNALLPRAMIVAGERLGATTMLAIGLQLLDWLIDIQTSATGQLSLIGDEGWARGAVRPQFPQRPAEATGLLLACNAAFSITGRDRYRETMERSFGWFSGANDLRRGLVDPDTGACAGLLTAEGLALPADAPATLEWLVAVEHIRALRPMRLSRGSVAATPSAENRSSAAVVARGA